MDNIAMTNADILTQGYCENSNDKKIYCMSFNDFVELKPTYFQKTGRTERIKNV